MTLRIRRLIAGLSLATYVFALVGIPLPLPVEKDVSQPFPCQHHRCGCRDAAQCWNHCCCFSRNEKLAWAQANGVTPPSEFLADDEDSDDATGHRGCSSCVEHAGANPVEHAGANQGCCATTKRVCCKKTDPPQPVASNSTDNYVVGIYALGCQGGSTVWVALATAVPLPPAVSLEHDQTPHEWVVQRTVHLTSLTNPPDTPPPRVQPSAS